VSAELSRQGSPRERWNRRYAADGFEVLPVRPSEWLVEQRALLEEVRVSVPEPRALDVACGSGRNARYLAELGFAVEAVDVSDVVVGLLRAAAVEAGLKIDARVLDLEREAPPADRYDVVVCTYYLQRDLFGALCQTLRHGGLLLYETFVQGYAEELAGDFNPAHILTRNELLRGFSSLHVRHYREGVAERRDGTYGVASLVAERLPAAHGAD